MSTSILVTIQQGITRYVMPIMITIANLSNIFSILIFLQKHQRSSSCSIYLVSAATFSIVSINWALIPTIYALNNPPDPFSQSLILCRLRGYILQIANNLYRTYLILACMDRYATSSPSARICRWATKKIAWRAIVITIIAWILIPTHLLIWETVENSKCSAFGTYATLYTIYLLIVIFAPLCLLSLFGFLTLHNLKRLHSHVTHSNANTTITISEKRRKRDIDLQRMVLMEVFVYLVLTSGYPIVFLYTTLTVNVTNKSIIRLQIESFVSFMTNSFL
ncbi:unnamed protein product [Adineta steineri]|uniref:G-protein coupled receptors family 1 profile domain-containing protein n=1 Tax=Adineta steineri TaxID=433720 RepID=A0A819FZX7_9BILA|nr:unnamed protein product [Adineta steineri]CAF3873983.1 unnamed protein product [Adineta steineri]